MMQLLMTPKIHGVIKGQHWTTGHKRLVSTSPYPSSHCSHPSKSPETPLLKQLKARIKFSGPLTVHEYMKEVLVNPISGYYSSGKDMLGTQGDFTTSPEISQMFGELVGVWLVSEWYKLGSPQPLQLVELGPGRGTFLQDILRVLSQFGLSGNDLSVHLVEVSKELSVEQEKKLCNGVLSDQDVCEKEELYYKTNTSTSGSPIFWYHHLSLVPRAFTIFLAHEFFDVLPIHKIQKTKEGWREVLVDLDEGDGPHHLRYVLSKSATPATKIFTTVEESRESIEVSPEAAVLCQELATRIEEDGGIALIMDYGHDGKDMDTFRAFKNHHQHHPLSEPGTADLTADVDFNFLKDQVKEKLLTFGPVTQASFLTNMGIETRLHNLMKQCKPEERTSLMSGFRMLTEPQQMGHRFKFLAFYPAVVKDFIMKFPPSGFYRNLD